MSVRGEREDHDDDGRRRIAGARDAVALAVALAAHVALFLTVTSTPTRRMFEDQGRRAIDVEIVIPPPPPVAPPVEEPPPPEKPPREEPPPREKAPEEPAKAQETPPAPETKPEETPPPTSAPNVVDEVPDGESVVRLKKGEGAIGRVLGTGGVLGPTTATLEKALDIRADGAMSDAKRAGTNARRFLESDMADDAVSAGLADDYFRALKNRVESNWRPAMKQLNDGGKSVTQIGMLKDLYSDDGRVAWDEMWKAYLDLAKQYANGAPPRLEPARVEKLRELMRSRKGAFRFQAIAEVKLTQGPDGKVLTIELPLSSGHPGIDDGVKDAITTAVAAMPDAPPARLHHGRSFTSTWRMRATWTMVPPTALLTGAGFDITPKGFQVDVPFDITLKSNVMLMRTDAHAHDDGANDNSSGGGEP